MTGSCGPNGTVRACHVNLGQHDGVIDCFAGSQECRGGSWSACGGTDVTLMSTQESVLAHATSARAGASPQALGAPTAVGSCPADPCNPYCRQSDDSASATADGGATVLYTFSGSEWGNAPGGFIGKQDCSPACGTGFPKACNGAPTHYNKFDACQAEHHCDAATGACVKNQVPADWKWPVATCAGIDLTVGPACVTGGVEGFNICNRGNTAMTVAQGPIKVFIDTGNGYDFGATGTCVSKAASCSIALAAPLAPGSCRLVVESECAAWGNGNKIAYVNSDQSVPECGAKVSGAGATMPGCNNNWSDIKKGGSACTSATVGGYAPTTRAQTLAASCPPGTQAWWNKLLYDVVAPAGTSVAFRAQVTAVTPDGGVGATWPAVGSFAAVVTESTTKNCSMGSGAGCPIDLTAALGGFPAASYANITIQTTLTPDPTLTTTPTLNSWAISYNCRDAE